MVVSFLTVGVIEEMNFTISALTYIPLSILQLVVFNSSFASKHVTRKTLNAPWLFGLDSYPVEKVCTLTHSRYKLVKTSASSNQKRLVLSGYRFMCRAHKFISDA